MTENEIDLIRCVAIELLERLKAYDNLLIPYSLRLDLRMFLERLSNIK